MMIGPIKRWLLGIGMLGVVLMGSGAFGETEINKTLSPLQSPAEWRKLPALDNQYEVIQLTTLPGDDCKLYYTTNPYIASKNWLIFSSTRIGANNLFYIDLSTGIITRLTDGRGKEIDAEHAIVCPATMEIF